MSMAVRRPAAILALSVFAVLAAGGVAVAQRGAARPDLATFDSAEDARRALSAAVEERRAASTRAARLEREAQQSQDAAARAARDSAAVAARIQQAEAGIAAERARIGLIGTEQARLGEVLGTRQRPMLHLTAALQQFARRPALLSVLRPGSVKDVVYVRAVLDSTVPQVQARTAELRNRLARQRALEEEATAATAALAAEQDSLASRRVELAKLEATQRLRARAAGGSASREAERALALAEEARDLDGLVGELDRAAALRAELAALPGPILRPAQPAAQRAAPVPESSATATAAASAPAPYQLPVTGRTVTGFGAPVSGGTSRGIALVPLGGAQVVAPAAGRVAFAGRYPGYGNIVIVEHAGGWTSLVTGLANTGVSVGDSVVAGAPLGSAPDANPRIQLELRRDGEPVNPAQFLR